MVETIQRYKFFILILLLLILAGAVWSIIEGRKESRIPLRGVFVFHSISCDSN